MFSTVALAQDAAAQGPSFLESMMLPLFILAIFFLFIIRPQQKRQKAHGDFLGSMKRGDNVITASGILGRIEGLTDKFVTLEVADGVRVRILKNQIASSMNEGQST